MPIWTVSIGEHVVAEQAKSLKPDYWQWLNYRITPPSKDARYHGRYRRVAQSPGYETTEVNTNR